MKICHSAILFKPVIGILKQMEIEHQSAIDLGLSWDVILFLPKGYNSTSPIVVESNFIDKNNLDSLAYKIYAWITLRIEYYFFLYRKQYDLLLLRYSVHDIFLLCFLLITKLIKRQKNFLVHHTLEEYELKLEKGFIGKLRYFLEKMIGKICISQSNGIIGVTNEILKYELNRSYKQENYIYPNGIIVNKKILKLKKKEFNGIYKILFIASEFSPWHGLDLLIRNLKANSRKDFELHIIGKVSDSDYNNITSDHRIIYHGVQDEKYILNLSCEIHVALGSFALYRNNINEACTLKVREYLSLGIPVYSGYKDVFDQSFEYYLQGEPNIDAIIFYAEKMINVDVGSVVIESMPYIDKRALLKELYNKIEKNKW